MNFTIVGFAYHPLHIYMAPEGSLFPLNQASSSLATFPVLEWRGLRACHRDLQIP